MSNEVKYLVVGDVNTQGSILFDSISAVDVPTPTAGKFALFNDRSNGNKLSSKDSGGIVTVVGSGGEDGADGAGFSPDAIGLLSGLSTYDDEPAGFSYLASDTGDVYFKLSATTGDWSGAIPFQGGNGDDGTSSYTYIAYASDDAGTGFSLTPSAALPYRAEIVSATAITTPTLSDFSGATWVKYIGEDGDMLIQNYAPTNATIELNPDTNIYTITINSATTFVFDTTALNLVAGQACTFELDLTMSTVSTLTFPASVNWVYGAPYMGDADKIYRLVFHSMDQGLSWHANLAFERSIA